jgi:hypothetical protein
LSASARAVNSKHVLKIRVSEICNRVIRKVTTMNTMSLQSLKEGATSNMLPVLDHEPAFGPVGSASDKNSNGLTTSVPPEPKARPKNLKITHTSKAVEKNTAEKGPIADAIHEVENLGKEAAIQCALGHLDEETNFGFKLGGVLTMIQRNEWYAPHASFKKFVEEECGMSYRKAKYLINSYVAVSTSKVDDEKLNDLSWCKLREIAPIITPENVDEWVAAASEHTVVELKEMVKAHKAKGNPKAITQQSAQRTRSRLFKLSEDQNAIVETAIAKAKEIVGTPDDVGALEYIFRDFAEDMQVARIEDRILELGLDASLKLIRKCFPDVEVSASVPEETTA